MKVLTSFLKASALYVTPVIFTTVMVKVIDQGGSVFHELSMAWPAWCPTPFVYMALSKKIVLAAVLLALSYLHNPLEHVFLLY